MYRLNLKELGRIGLIQPTTYSKILGLSANVMYMFFRGETTTKLSTAKGIISLAYDIPIGDSSIDELVEKHFIKEN